MNLTTEKYMAKSPNPSPTLIESDRHRPLPLYDGKWSVADSSQNRQRIGSNGLGI